MSQILSSSLDVSGSIKTTFKAPATGSTVPLQDIKNIEYNGNDYTYTEEFSNDIDNFRVEGENYPRYQRSIQTPTEGAKLYEYMSPEMWAIWSEQTGSSLTGRIRYTVDGPDGTDTELRIDTTDARLFNAAAVSTGVVRLGSSALGELRIASQDTNFNGATTFDVRPTFEAGFVSNGQAPTLNNGLIVENAETELNAGLSVSSGGVYVKFGGLEVDNGAGATIDGDLNVNNGVIQTAFGPVEIGGFNGLYIKNGGLEIDNAGGFESTGRFRALNAQDAQISGNDITLLASGDQFGAIAFQYVNPSGSGAGSEFAQFNMGQDFNDPTETALAFEAKRINFGTNAGNSGVNSISLGHSTTDQIELIAGGGNLNLEGANINIESSTVTSINGAPLNINSSYVAINNAGINQNSTGSSNTFKGDTTFEGAVVFEGGGNFGQVNIGTGDIVSGTGSIDLSAAQQHWVNQIPGETHIEVTNGGTGRKTDILLFQSSTGSLWTFADNINWIGGSAPSIALGNFRQDLIRVNSFYGGDIRAEYVGTF
jgi:hypothetical protein